jgi:hypothetical protein
MDALVSVIGNGLRVQVGASDESEAISLVDDEAVWRIPVGTVKKYFTVVKGLNKYRRSS